MRTSRPSLHAIENDLRSDDQALRLRASQGLLDWVREDPAVHARAAVAFRGVIDRREDAPTVNNATRGIELIEGPQAAWDVRVALLQDPRPDFVRWVALSIADPAYAPVLLDLLDRRPEAGVQGTVVRVLGRLRVPAAFDAIVRRLDRPDVRPDAVEALAELGDARAAAHLRPLLDDRTAAWEEDNHGPMLYVCDLAERAIARLGHRPVPLTPAGVAAPLLGALGVGAAAPPAPRWARLLCYVPLVLAVLELPWCVLVIMSQMGYKPGGFPREAQRAVTAVMALPAAIGLAVGLRAVFRHHATTKVEAVFLVLGLVVCGLLVAAFALSILQ